MENPELSREEIASLMQRVLYEVKKIVVGQDHFLERVLRSSESAHVMLREESGNGAPHERFIVDDHDSTASRRLTAVAT